jgi:ribosomal 50S subunit-recycling heat shock protein
MLTTISVNFTNFIAVLIKKLLLRFRRRQTKHKKHGVKTHEEVKIAQRILVTQGNDDIVVEVIDLEEQQQDQAS